MSIAELCAKSSMECTAKCQWSAIIQYPPPKEYNKQNNKLDLINNDLNDDDPNNDELNNNDLNDDDPNDDDLYDDDLNDDDLNDDDLNI